MTARILSTHADNKGTPVIKLKGVWLREAGFKDGDKIAVCVDRNGKITIFNMETEMHKHLEEEFQDLVIIV